MHSTREVWRDGGNRCMKGTFDGWIIKGFSQSAYSEKHPAHLRYTADGAHPPPRSTITERWTAGASGSSLPAHRNVLTAAFCFSIRSKEWDNTTQIHKHLFSFLFCTHGISGAKCQLQSPAWILTQRY